MSNTSSGIKIPKIPNRYITMHPLNPPEVRQPDERPAVLNRTTMVRYILRNGDKGCAKAGALWWGDNQSSASTAIVAYKVIRLEGAWTDWGHKFDRGEQLDISFGGIPVGLEPTARVQIWLRDYPTPQGDIRKAEHWDWNVSGENGGDIMKYRVLIS